MYIYNSGCRGYDKISTMWVNPLWKPITARKYCKREMDNSRI